MKRIIALILMLCMLLSVGSVTAFASTPLFEVSEHWKTNVVIFYNTDDIFNAATICYCADNSENWQSAEMTYGGLDEYGEDSWYFTMPEGRYRYYITDDTHRTKEEIFTGEILLYLLNETDENGYYKLWEDMFCGPFPVLYFADKFAEYCASRSEEVLDYDELYYHYTDDGELDWVLLNAHGGFPDPWYGMGIIGNRVIVSGTFPVFTFGMGLYDVKKDTFYDLYNMKDYDQFEGLAEAIDGYGKGKLLGDLDGDDEISIIDVTILQRCEAKIREYPESDWIVASDQVDDVFKPIHYYSDFNRDGERDILDATCIQRYLVGLTYPRG